MNSVIRIDGSETGRGNMDLDLAMHAEVLRGTLDIGFRIYTWNPWCVSLGKHQTVDGLNQQALHELNLDVVHRPTGGRAVLHAEEVTYCVCVRMPDASKAQLVYAAIHDMLFEVLSAVAPGLTHASLSSDLRTHYSSQQPIGQACFSSHAKSEILWNNKKVVGSAQRVMDGALLQHGSILCEPGHELLARVIAKSEEDATAIRGLLLRASATLTEASSRRITKESVVESFVLHESALERNLESISSLATGAAR